MQSVSDQAVGAGVIRSVRPDQQLVKVDMKITLFSQFCKIYQTLFFD